jgi:hypothetical protein
VTNYSFGKGCSGNYYICGKAYLNNNMTLVNVKLTVIFGKDTIQVITDSKGKFELELKWKNACPSLLSEEEHNEQNSKINPKFIYIKYFDKQIELENNWKNFAHCVPKSKKQITRRYDLKFN